MIIILPLFFIHRNSEKQKHCQTPTWCTRRCPETGNCECFSATRTLRTFWLMIGSHWWTPLKSPTLSGFHRTSRILSESSCESRSIIYIVENRQVLGSDFSSTLFPAFWHPFRSFFLSSSWILFTWTIFSFTWRCWKIVTPPCLESQGCQFDPSFLISPILFFCIVLLLFLSFPFLLLTHFPDFCFPKPSFSER